ncbi:hypothetical protein B0O80DRAFT_497149 [Mortierella sp. GBAus27b]|nr:hypothetical protein BGX31_001731 [Mortierella sp. GBA43]KAI8356447.1 hypothetical protein B0O80DRAFT_497149 [Mortierella sp. GBAus27b]
MTSSSTTVFASKGAVTSKQAVKEKDKKTFFNAEGMDTFVDWITDAENYERLTKKRPISGHKLTDVHDDIAKYVNSLHGTTWDRSTVKSKLQYVKKKYDQARDIMSSTGEGNTDTETLSDRVLILCPPFDKLDTVFGTSLSRNPLPPVQTLPPQHGDPVNPRGPTPEMVDEGDVGDVDSDYQSIDDTASHSTRESSSDRGNKRRKTDKNPSATLQEHFNLVAQAAERQRIAKDNMTDELRRRHEAIETRERDLTERLLDIERKHHEMLMKREEQHWEMLAKREEEHREQLQRQWDRRMRELDDEKAEFKEEKAEFKEEKAQFRKERDEMLQDVAAMKKELEISRSTCTHHR